MEKKKLTLKPVDSHRTKRRLLDQASILNALVENLNYIEATGSISINEEQKENVVFIQDVSEARRRELGSKAILSLYWPNNIRKNCTVLATFENQTIFRSEAEAIASAVAQDIDGRDTLLIKTRSLYATLAYTRWSREWIKNGWKTTKGTDVKHRDVFERGLRHIRERPGKVKFILVPPQGPIEDELSYSLSCIKLDEN